MLELKETLDMVLSNPLTLYMTKLSLKEIKQLPQSTQSMAFGAPHMPMEVAGVCVWGEQSLTFHTGSSSYRVRKNLSILNSGSAPPTPPSQQVRCLNFQESPSGTSCAWNSNNDRFLLPSTFLILFLVNSCLAHFFSIFLSSFHRYLLSARDILINKMGTVPVLWS